MGAAVPFVGLGLSAAGIGFDIAGQAQAASQQKRQAILAEMFARQRAQDAIARGGNEVARTLGEADRIAGSQRAGIAHAGFEIGTGTAADIVNATNLVASADVITIRENARREAIGHLQEAFGASEYGRQANATAGIAGTLIAGAGSIASNWYARSARNKTAAEVNAANEKTRPR